MANGVAPADVRRVACVGSGTIGGGWVAYFLAQGLDVQAYDPSPEARQHLRSRIEAAWPNLEGLGLANGASIDRFVLCDTLEQMVEGADYVQESIIERKDQKIELFGAIDAVADPSVVIATSSSSFLPSELAAKATVNPGRCIVAHPFAPTYLIPLVEILGGESTPSEVISWAVEFFRHIGKAPVVLRKEIGGYIGNRLQGALMAEARNLVDQGVCSYRDIDDVIANSFGVRMAFSGACMYYHLGGGRGGLAHTFEQFGWNGSEESKQDLIRSVEEISEGASIPELERWRDDNLVRLLNARRLSVRGDRVGQ